MKKILLVFALFVSAVSCYNDSAIWDELRRQDERIKELEMFCEEINSNISSLRLMVTAIQENDYVTDVVKVMRNDVVIGYELTFSKRGTVIIYHGKDGENGKDGAIPAVGVKKDDDGIYYWTIDGQWLLDDSGQKIQATGKDGQIGESGKDGVTPKLKIEEGYWYVSYNDGETWDKLYKAVGEDGQNGDSMFSGIDVADENYVILTLLDGTEVKIPTWKAFEALQKIVNTLNTNISSLQSAVKALEDNDYVSSILPYTENGEVVGYMITFSKSGTVIIFHGKDGENGKDGTIPVIGVKKDDDGLYYWTIDGQWILDDSGEKILVTGKDGQTGESGKDGVTPKLKIEEGYWYVSYNDGETWDKLGKAVGEDGQNGDSFFQGIEIDENEVRLILADGDVITIPLVASDLLARIKSIIHIPDCEDGKSAFFKTYDDDKGYAEIDFLVTPSSVLPELDLRWQDLFSLRVVETMTKSVTLVDLEIIGYKSDVDNGSFTITVSGKNLSDDFYRGRQSYGASLLISDGDNEISSGFFDIIALDGDNKPDKGLSQPCLSWGEDIDDVKEYMAGYKLDYSDSFTLIYSGCEAEHMISYEFENGRLCASAMFVEVDKVSIDEVLALFDGYDVLRQFDGDYGEYADSESNTYAEISIADKSDTKYYFIGWSEYVVDVGGNTITYLSSNNKAIPVSTLDGFGADLVANQYDKNANIGKLVFSAPVTAIPSMAFSGAATLKSIDLPESVKKIGKNAFANSGLTSIKIPKGVQSIDNDAFVGCTSLSRVLIDNLSSWCEILFGNANANPLSCAGELYLGDKLVTDLVIPENVSFVDDYAFYGAKCLKTVSVPETLSGFGVNVFYGCDSLNKVFIDNLSTWCRTEFGYKGNPLCYAKKLYLNDVLLTELIVPDDVSEISQYSFNGCSSLLRIVISDNVTSVGMSAFENCSEVTEVYVSKNLKVMGANAFSYCDNINKVETGSLLSWCNIDFANTSSNPFNKGAVLCVQGDLITHLDIPSNITKINNYAFRGCTSISEIVIPDSVIQIGDSAFYGLTSLKSIKFSKNLSTIGAYAFSGCSSLGVVSLPENLETIGYYAFYNCESLKTIFIPDSVNDIAYYAFANCYNVANVTIGAGVKSIGNCAFYGCCKYSGAIYLKAMTPPQIGGSIWYTTIDIHVPRSAVNIYKSNDSWRLYNQWIVGYDF